MIVQNKKIVRIGGTPYCGSTMLDLMLGNADDAFSMGEVHHIFRPKYTKHLNPVCSCGDQECDLWLHAQKQGEENFLHFLMGRFPEVSTFIDSSKNPVWFLDQEQYLKKLGFNILNLLIWKTPEEFAYSMWKRGKLKNWKRTYINSYSVYFHIFPKWYSVSYTQLATSPAETLERCCQQLGIHYFCGKERYWEKKHHSLYGSHTARIHLYRKDSSRFNNIKLQRIKFKPNINIYDNMEMKHHRSIYYENLDSNPDFPIDEVKKQTKDKKIITIVNILKETAVGSDLNFELVKRELLNLKPPLLWHQRYIIKRRFIFLKNRLRGI